MKLVVKKFGGTSVGTIARIQAVADLILDYRKKNPDTQIVVVASAMSGETNRLIALARSCVAAPDPRELDQMVVTGEQVSNALLAMALIQKGIPARSFTAPQMLLKTDRNFTSAHIEDINPKPLRDAVASEVVPVVAGFQGITPEGDLTTLGRGGSDITAVAVAAALKADACYIYTDVDGVYSTDPRICRTARRLDRVCHEEMLELASLGAKVLHPRSVFFAKKYGVPLVTLSSFEPGPGTWVVSEEELVEKPLVTGVTYRTDEAKLTVTRIPGGIRGLNTLVAALAAENVFIDMITQTGYVGDKTSISFTIPDEVSSQALTIAQDLVPRIGAEGASLDRDITKVSVVGVGMQYHTGVAATVFATLAAHNIDVQMITTSEIKISVVVARKYGELTVRALHDAFIPAARESGNPLEISVEK